MGRDTNIGARARPTPETRRVRAMIAREEKRRMEIAARLEEEIQKIKRIKSQKV